MQNIDLQIVAVSTAIERAADMPGVPPWLRAELRALVAKLEGREAEMRRSSIIRQHDGERFPGRW
jgi:hypothetical protein